MPKTKFEDLIFSVLMSFTMVYVMELYNLALNNGGMTNQLFIAVFQDAFIMMIVVFVVEKLFAGRIAKKLALRIIDPKVDKPFFMILAIQCFTVCIMSPTMSLIATIVFKNPGNQIISVWLQTVVFNFPLAFFWQVFFAGPLVRFIFRAIFNRKSVCVASS